MTTRMWVACALGLAFSPAAFSEITKPCLNSDAEAQARLVLYELRSDPRALSPAVQPVAGGSAAATENKAAANDLTAYASTQLSKEKLTDWDKWPVRRLAFGGDSAEFMAVHITNKDGTDRPCLRLMFRVFAPGYLEDAGFGFFISDYEKAKQRRIKASEAFGATVVYDYSEQFYIINLTRLKNTKFWRDRYAVFQKNVAVAKDVKSPPVYFDRFVFNVLRLSRYQMPRMHAAERPKFIEATFSALAKRSVDCGANKDHPACILNSVFMETELGAAHPLSVTDALDNSGLAFGPRQLDLGQGRKDATDFALAYLLEPAQKADKWQAKYFRPIESLALSEVKSLYKDAIPYLNSRLEDNGSAVIELYVSGLVQMVSDDYGIARINLTDNARLLSTVVTADFSNKWGKGSAVTLVARIRQAVKQQLDECGFLGAWHKAIRETLQPGDLRDAMRRSDAIQRQFSRFRTGGVASCPVS